MLMKAVKVCPGRSFQAAAILYSIFSQPFTTTQIWQRGPGQYSIVPMPVVCVPESCQMPLPGDRISPVYFVKKQVKAFSLQKTLATPEVLSLLGSSVVACIPVISSITVGIPIDAGVRAIAGSKLRQEPR